MTHQRRISVIGLGYVGLPVAVTFGRAGDRAGTPAAGPVVAFDIDPVRVDELRRGIDRTNEVTRADLQAADLLLTSDAADLRQADFHIVAVPTPITETKRPDLRPLLAATRTVGEQLKRGDIVVFESTVYPGATEEDCLPILEACSNLKAGVDFSIGYSPERINPGDTEHRFETITKVVSADTPTALEVVAQVYGSVVRAGVHKAATIRTAEAAKVIENTQRDLNIALMNELAVIFERLGLDTSDVLAAAGTKWNFLKFSPGLVGGHCIGVDPYYLTFRAQRAGYHPEVILAGRRINDDLGRWIVAGTVKRLLAAGLGATPRVTILGVTFKENVPDVRNTRVVDMVAEFAAFGIPVQVHDPMADPKDVAHEFGIELVPADALRPADAVILAVPHDDYRAGGWPRITGCLKGGAGLVVDVRSILDRASKPDAVTLWRI